MDNTEKLSDQLINEIMKLEHEIEKIKALNGNREDFVVQQYQKFISIKKNKLKKINGGYKDHMPFTFMDDLPH